METGDLTDEELGSLEVTAGWLQNKSPVAQLQHNDEARLGRRIEAAVLELRRRRATEQFLRGYAAGLSRHSTPGRIVAEALLRILDGGAA